MRTRIIESMKLAAYICDVDFGAGNIEDAHLACGDVSCVFNSYQQSSTFLNHWLNYSDFRYSTKSFFSCSVKSNFLKPL